MRNAVLFAGLVGMVVCTAASSWAAATPGLYVQVTQEKDTSSNLTGKLAARIRVVGLPTAREVVFHLGCPTAYGVDTGVDDIRIKAVKPGVDVMSIDTNQPPTPSNPADDTPVCFAEGATTTLRDVWVVALLTSSTTDPKVVCDVLFTCQGRPTTANVVIDAVQVKDASLNLLASAGNFSSTADGTGTGAACPLYGDLNWNNQIDFNDVLALVQAWKANAASIYCPYADITPDDGGAELATRTSVGNGTLDFNDILGLVHAWRKANTGNW
jgi:hypothetical protein